MKKKMTPFLLSVAICIPLMTGCSFESSSSTVDPNNPFSGLEDNMFYVVNEKDESITCTPIYESMGTFEVGTTASSASDSRILWYKNDWEEIPTIYEGDYLIFHSTTELEEKFNFERFEDFGYTIGICQLQETPSGRFKVSTSVDDCTTYPDGDTDNILNFTQDSVIIDKVGKVELRKNNVSRCGTITNLIYDNVYEVEIYEGTILTTAYYRADVRALGSMDVDETNDFDFINETVIRVNIPEYFNSGYYCINGIGIFRYVTGAEYNDDTNFNIPNEKEAYEDELINNNNNQSNTSEDNSTTTENESFIASNETVKTFEIKQQGHKEVLLDISMLPNVSISGLPAVYAVIVTPSGQEIEMTSVEEGLVANFKAYDEGTYTVKIINLTAYREAEIIITDL